MDDLMQPPVRQTKNSVPHSSVILVIEIILVIVTVSFRVIISVII